MARNTDLSPRFNKGILSGNIRTRCDLALYLTLFEPEALKDRKLPLALEARHGIGLIKNAGVEFETSVYERLFGHCRDAVIGNRVVRRGADGKEAVKWEDRDLRDCLVFAGEGRRLIVQSRFTMAPHAEQTFRNLGVSASNMPGMPRMGKVIPDLIIVRPPTEGDEAIGPDGARFGLEPGDRRQVLTIADAKHAVEPNPSYEAEVVLYSVLMANWLVANGLDGRFVVGASPRLWTRGDSAGTGKAGGLETLADCVAKALCADDTIAAIEKCLEKVNVPVHAQEIRRFFAERLPDVMRRGDADWTKLDWHVSPACGSCDWLGHEEWLDKEQRELVRCNPTHYCMRRAEMQDHLSQIPGLTRGAAKALRARDIHDVATLVDTDQDAEVFGDHTLLAASRRVLPLLARAVQDGAVERDDRRVDGMLPASSDLTIHVGVDFDAGAGLLTGLVVDSAFFKPLGPKKKGAVTPSPKGTKPHTERDAFVVERKTPAAERVAVLGFLRCLAKILRHATSTDPDKGGEHAARATACVLFWSRGQFDALCDALGRHLGAILQEGDDVVTALAWLFPNDSLQERTPQDERHPAVVFLRDVSGRLLRTPARHAATLVSLAKVYPPKEQDGPPLPHPFYTEPFSDKIPRERIYEIWEMEDGATRTLMVQKRHGTTNAVMRDATGAEIREEKEFVRADFVAMFARALRLQVIAMCNVTRHLRQDFKGRLYAKAPRIVLAPPSWTSNVAFDAKLWLARAEFAAAHERQCCLLRFLADPDEIEASLEGIRLLKLVETKEDGSLVYAISKGSANAKLKAPDASLCLAFEAEPGFAARQAWTAFPEGGMPADLKAVSRRALHSVFEATLVEIDRAAFTATVRLNPPRGKMADKILALRDALLGTLGRSLDGGLVLMPSMPTNVTLKRLANVMAEVGDPSIAVPDAATCAALGAAVPPQPGQDPITPIARVLWDAPSLAARQVLDPVAVERVLAVDRKLDPSQSAAVRAAAARGLTIIWGPPGTGKTATLRGFLHGICRESSDRGGRHSVLVTGPTYKAVAEVANRLIKALLADHAGRATVALVGAADKPMLDDKLRDEVGRAADRLTVIETPADAKEAGFGLVNERLEEGGVVVVCAVTHQCARFAEQRSELTGIPRRMVQPLFDTMVLDEASQVDMTTGAFPLALLKEGARVVIAGDDLQMPPVQAVEPPKGAEHMVGSVMSYLIARFGIEKVPLLVNYRSNDEIVSYCRGLGYPKGLRAHNHGARISLGFDPRDPAMGEYVRSRGLPWSDVIPELLEPERGLVALTYPDGMAGQSNRFEGKLVAATVTALAHCAHRVLDGYPDDDGHGPGRWGEPGCPKELSMEGFFRSGIGIVTPHRAQRTGVVEALKEAFPDVDPEVIGDAVDTVERFQGGQRHTIIISFGVGDPDVIQGEERFLMGLERTNVAISRAMAKCIVVMSEEIATHIPVDRKASESAHALRGVVDEWCRQRVSAPSSPCPDHPSRRLVARWR